MKFINKIFFLFSVLFLTSTVMAIEEPEYKILEKYDDIEIRQYSPFLVAEVIVEGNFEEASNKAFTLLFDYISGENIKQESIEMTAPVNQEEIQGEKIEMTAPVNQEITDNGNYRVAFVMPARFTMETLPKPNNKRVVLSEVPAKKVAVITYSGTWSEDNYKEHENELLQFIKQKKYTALNKPVWSRYNAPFIPWFLRRNEIMVEIK